MNCVGSVMSYYIVYGFSSFLFLMLMPGNPRDISFSCVKQCHSTFSQMFARERRQREDTVSPR